MPKRTPEHMNAQRERILRAAIRSIGDHGLDQTSIATICAAAGLSTGAIYKHFTSKEEIVEAALRFAAMDDAPVPGHWNELRKELSRVEEESGFDVETVARTNLQLLASSLRPGPLKDLLRPGMLRTHQSLAAALAEMQRAEQISLKLSPLQTAMCITALADGLTWVGLATNRSPDEIRVDISAGLDCFIL